jgi:O-antigen/teichoic acid export membrane protein
LNFIIYFINEGISKILPFVTIIVSANFLEVADFGTLTMYYIVLEVLTIVISNNVRATTRLDYFKFSFEEYVLNRTAHHLGSFIIFILLLALLSFLFPLIENIPYKYIYIMLFVALFRGWAFHVLSHFQCEERAGQYGLHNLIPIGTMNLSFICLLYFDFGIDGWLYATLIGAVIQSLLTFKVFYTEKILNFTAIRKPKLIFDEFKHGLLFLPQSIGFWVGAAADRLIISNFLGVLIVGHYMFAFQLVSPIIIFSTVVNLYVTPIINRYIKEMNYKKIVSILYKYSFYLILFSLVIYFSVQYFIKEFYFIKYHNSLEYLPYIVASIMLQSMHLIFVNVYYYINLKKIVSYFIFTFSILKASAAFMFMSEIGMGAFLWCNILLNASALLVTIIFLHFKTKIKVR